MPEDTGTTPRFIESLLAERPLRTLFHYTSQEGLLGILRTKTLRASSIQYMNDAAEFSYALEVVRSTLDNALKYERGPFNDFYGTVLDKLQTIRHISVFAFSLSEEGDLLSQWRGYCPNGIGYSVGFEHNDLAESMQRQGFRLIKCVYGPSQHQKIINEIGERAIDRLGGTFGSPDRPARLAETAQVFVDGLVQIGPAMKHPSFREEREWRLVSSPIQATHPNVRFRPGKSMIIPYYEFELDKANGQVSLSKIYVGPNPHMYLSIRSVVDALNASGVRWGSVIRSSLPYRVW